MKTVEIQDASKTGCQYSLVTFFVLILYTGALIGLYVFYFRSVSQPGSWVNGILFHHPAIFISATIFGIPLSYFLLGFGCEWLIRRRARKQQEPPV